MALVHGRLSIIPNAAAEYRAQCTEHSEAVQSLPNAPYAKSP